MEDGDVMAVNNGVNEVRLELEGEVWASKGEKRSYDRDADANDEENYPIVNIPLT